MDEDEGMDDKRTARIGGERGYSCDQTLRSERGGESLGGRGQVRQNLFMAPQYLYVLRERGGQPVRMMGFAVENTHSW